MDVFYVFVKVSPIQELGHRSGSGDGGGGAAGRWFFQRSPTNFEGEMAHRQTPTLIGLINEVI